MKISKLILGFVLIFLSLHVCPAWSTDLSDTLVKRFKSIEFPHDEKTVLIKINTPIHYLRGNSRESDALTSLKIHEKFTDSLGKHGWQKDDSLQIDSLNGGKIELEVGEGANLRLHKTFRLKVFLHMCDRPMKKYRGGDLNEFFQKIIEDAEYCLTYDNRLQGKNYPY